MQTRVAAYGVIIRDGLLLLSHWQEGDSWTLPGGGLEFGEPPADAAVREIFEETGFVASIDRLLGVDSFVIPVEDRIPATDEPLHSIQIVYAASIVSGELTHESEGSSDEARWVPLDEVGRLPHVRHVDFGVERWRGGS